MRSVVRAVAWSALGIVVAWSFGSGTAAGQEAERGKRPYELEWAGRDKDTRPPLVDFENCDNWAVETTDAKAQWQQSVEQLIWGETTGKLTYRGEGNQPNVVVAPPEPVSFDGPVDCVNLWVYGNNWAWAPDSSTPQVVVSVLLADSSGNQHRIELGRVRWKEWWLMHRRLSQPQQEALAQGGTFRGLEIRGGRNRDDRFLFFDNLAVYKEELNPLDFEPRPARGVDPFPGQSPGLNTGDDRLPFPNREKTLLPDNLTDGFKVTLGPIDASEDAQAWQFRYEGEDGQLAYTYRPETGTLGDVTARWKDGPAFRPMVEGGLYLSTENGPELATSAELLRCEADGDVLEAVWELENNGEPVRWTYRFRLWQKSLVVDVACSGGEVEEVRFGHAEDWPEPKLVTLPYLTCGTQRPAVLVGQTDGGPLFLFGLIDYYRSNASELWAVNRIEDNTAAYNGGSRYLPKTDGRRNNCFERLFLTVSPRFEEILPNIPNPQSPWMHVAGEVVWRAHGAGDREADWRFWRRIARHGMSKILVTDHEVGWRDGGESFTLRTRAAPGKGGDEGQAWYARNMHALGFRYGIYNNYTDFAPVNEFWDEDYVTREPDGEWRRAWARCYNLKPSRAVELEARLAPIIQQKFQLSTAYCDVHTAVRPWQYCDYDARVPGAGTFAATFYAYGEIMLHQKDTWNGPVYSEGNNHWYYCGLTDGNYGQDQLARLDVNPWLVDFDLRKLHPLCCNFGMGNLGMFYGHGQGLGATPGERTERLDRFLAATLAFGHTGFLVTEGGIPSAAQSYFAIQQPAAHYAQATVESIHYHDGQGRLLDTSQAVAEDAYRRSQLIVRFSNGLVVRVNGHPEESWTIDGFTLPPNGWYISYDRSAQAEPPGQTEANAGQRPNDLVAWSALREGHRADYVDSPAYLYANARGVYTRFPEMATDGQLVAVRLPGNQVEVIPLSDCTEFAVGLGGADAQAVALDETGNNLGSTETRYSRGLVHITPFPGAFSYLLTPEPVREPVLRCDVYDIVPGQVVTVTGAQSRELRFPADVKIGAPQWLYVDGHWLDFRVRPVIDAELSPTPDGVRLKLRSRWTENVTASVALAGEEASAELPPGQAVEIPIETEPAEFEQVRAVKLEVSCEAFQFDKPFWIASEYRRLVEVLPREWIAAGEAVRGAGETSLRPNSGAIVDSREVSCGGENRQAVFMHPPYKQGVGYTYADFGPVELPAAHDSAFRCAVGKADGSDSGDGILFRVLAAEVAESSPESEDFTMLTEMMHKEHSWEPLAADLSRWRGKTIRLRLMADVGDADNSSGDWAAWSALRIESAEPVLQTTVHDTEVKPRRTPPPDAVSTPFDAKAGDNVQSGVLHFEAIGLEGLPPYLVEAELNGVSLGSLPSTHGSETEGTWASGSLELPDEAIATLQRWNRLVLTNPGRDSFKIRNVRLELRHADGTTRSSWVCRSTYTQPGSWRYASGEGVAFGEPISFDILLAPSPPEKANHADEGASVTWPPATRTAYFPGAYAPDVP